MFSLPQPASGASPVSPAADPRAPAEYSQLLSHCWYLAAAPIKTTTDVGIVLFYSDSMVEYSRN